MLDALYHELLRYATLPTMAVLLVVAITCMAALRVLVQKLAPHEVLDVRRWYSPEDAREFFEAIEEPGRRAYVLTAMSVDFIFPIAYGTLLAMGMVCLYRTEWGKVFVLAPLLSALADILENVINAHVAWHFNHRASSLSLWAAMCTMVKWWLLRLTGVLLLFGAVRTWF